jgi:poly-beta-1,6 N-acetyl-D-glucosamine synthase
MNGAERIRAHWLLLTVSVAALAGTLVFHGYSSRAFGSTTVTDDTSAAVEAMTTAGPIVDLGEGTVRSVHAPQRTVAFTFDDGPDPHWTPQILDVLKRHQVPATFFVLGSEVAAHPDLTRRIVDDGHELGNHTYTHADLASVPPWRARLEMRLTQVAIAAATGRHVVVARPPYSSIPSAVRTDTLIAWRAIAQEGYLIALSDIDPKDWKPGVTADEIVAAAIPGGDAGGVVLLHDGGGDRSATVEALETVIVELRSRGYSFVTVGEIAGASVSATNPEVQRHVEIQSSAIVFAAAAGRFVADAFTFFAIFVAVLTVIRAAALVAFARRHKRTLAPFDPSFTPTVSIVVPAYNEAAGIEAAVRSLATSAYPFFEVIVVDDGSTDDTAAIAAALVERSRWGHVRILRQANGGKPAALNTGIGAAYGDIIVTVDGDTVFEPGTVAALVQRFADLGVGAVSGNTKVANREALIGKFQHVEYVIGFNLDRRLQDLAGCMTTVPGAIGAFRAAALEEIGGVSSDTLAEDTDVTMALHRAGWKVVYEPRAVAWTEAPGRLADLWRQRYRWSYGTMQAVWKHKHALVERGNAGRLGRRGLPYLVVFQILLTLAGPAVDVFTLYGLVFLDPWLMAGFWVGFTALQTSLAVYALRLDGEPGRDAAVLVLQQVVYRQMMYLVVIESLVTAVSGARTSWQTLRRRGIGAIAPAGSTSPGNRR